MHTFKITILIILLLSIIIVSGLYSFNTLETSSKKIENQLVEVENSTLSEDWEKAKSWMDSVNSNWKTTSKAWTILIDNDEIDYIDESLSKMDKYILVKDKSMALAEIATLQLYIKHIPDKESFNIKNIL
jgi:hypothetical protein